MQCERLKTLIRDWYQQVRDYTLSPIKMMELVNRHIKNCEVCQNDEDLPLELDQLKEIIRVPHIPNIKEEQEEPELLFEEELHEEEF